MPFSVYIAKPPVGGGYGPQIYKVGKTTEPDVQSRVESLNDEGSNYQTANGENWELVDHFAFENRQQMNAFDDAMAANLGTGVDPHGTGATEMFMSAALGEDVRDSALAAGKTLIDEGLVDAKAVARLAAENGIAATQFDASADDLPEEAVEEIAVWFLELLAIGASVVGVGLLLWRGKRIYGWFRKEWEQASERARSEAPPRPVGPEEVAEARRALELARDETESRQQAK